MDDLPDGSLLCNGIKLNTISSFAVRYDPTLIVKITTWLRAFCLFKI
jgi:hypothetical protein